MSLRTSMHRSHLPRSGMALGGIGAGWFEIRHDGGFYNWSIYNNAPLFTGSPFPFGDKQALFFVLRIQIENENPRLVLLQIEDSHNVGAISKHEYQYIFPWLSGVDVIHANASFPFTELEFEQDGLPLRVEMKAWSSFIPNNVKDSALPNANFDFKITSQTDRKIDVQIVATARNSVAYDQENKPYRVERIDEGDFQAVRMSRKDMDPLASSSGEVVLTSHGAGSTAYMSWEHHHPYYEMLLRETKLSEVDDTHGRNNLNAATGKIEGGLRSFCSIAKAEQLTKRGQVFQHRFSLSWYFPNQYSRALNDPSLIPGYTEDENFPGNNKESLNKIEENQKKTSFIEGHYYQHHFGDAKEVARYVHQEMTRLHNDTKKFHTTFFDSSLKSSILDQINSQLNTFFTSTWLTHTNMYGVLEGLSPFRSFAGIGTTDVAMYGQIATGLLFPELDRMTVNFWRKCQNTNGSVIHSIVCNSKFIKASELTGQRLDMPAQYAFQCLRAGLWSCDKEYLTSLWPSVKKALAYVLRERDFNNDLLPDMQGVMCSYDNFPMYGVAPYVASQWLLAVSSSLKAARILNDDEFVQKYEVYLEKGKKVLEEATWNGQYFKLYSDHQESDPNGENGCMSDQIIGDGMCQQLGLAPVIDREKAILAMHKIMSMNFKEDQGLLNCQWPEDQFLHPVSDNTWVDQANTCWTGVELNFAAQLYSYGLNEFAEKIIDNVDQRYRHFGMYWDHQEFGGHYFRPMSALAIPGAFLGQSFDGETLTFSPTRELPLGRWCVLLPGGYATLMKSAHGGKLILHSGNIQPRTIILPFTGEISVEGFQNTFEVTENMNRSVLKSH